MNASVLPIWGSYVRIAAGVKPVWVNRADSAQAGVWYHPHWTMPTFDSRGTLQT